MRLTIEQNPESTRRYAHLEKARGWGGRSCSVQCPGSRRRCTREREHRGPHVSHGLFGKVLAVWESARASRPSSEAPLPTRGGDAPRRGRRRERGDRPIGIRKPSPLGLADTMRSVLARLTASAEEVAWLAFLLAFLGFAAYGFKLIYLG